MKSDRIKLLTTGLVLFIGILFLYKCTSDNNHEAKKKEQVEKDRPKVDVPTFNADSAYFYTKIQTEFGPRVPGTSGHISCGDYLVSKFKNFGADVIEQTGEVLAFDGSTLPMRNIIAQFQVEKPKRILLFAHWDTRPFADKDSTNINDPIDGANDGASGVGVLVEVARILSSKNTEYGIDIVLFDTEDYGAPEGSMVEGNYKDWCLGSQFWANEPHKQGYKAEYGILLDMVGAPDATFPREGTSMYFAPRIVRKVWNVAAELGFGNKFVNDVSGETIDDHLFVNQITGIPSIAIVHYETKGEKPGYGHFHHTHKDSMEGIDKNTLGQVGQVLLQVIYQDF